MHVQITDVVIIYCLYDQITDSMLILLCGQFTYCNVLLTTCSSYCGQHARFTVWLISYMLHGLCCLDGQLTEGIIILLTVWPVYWQQGATVLTARCNCRLLCYWLIARPVCWFRAWFTGCQKGEFTDYQNGEFTGSWQYDALNLCYDNQTHR